MPNPTGATSWGGQCYALLTAAGVAAHFFVKACVKNGLIGQILDRKACGRNSAALPLQIPVSVIRVSARAAMVRAVSLDNHRPTLAHQ